MHWGSLDLEKVHNRMLREELLFYMREPGGAEKYVRLVQDI